MKEKDKGLRPHKPGVKDDADKICAGMLADFSLALQAVAEVGNYGLHKYTRCGWETVVDGILRYYDAKWRHLLAERHESYDPDSGLLHAAHEAWNTLARLELMLRGGGKGRIENDK